MKLRIGRRRREHQHYFGGDGSLLYIGPANVAKVSVCRGCGQEVRSLTPAGVQQFGWWLDRGVPYDEAYAKVWACEDALQRWVAA